MNVTEHTIHQLSEAEFNEFIGGIENRNTIKKYKAQLALEQRVVAAGWTFAKSYKYHAALLPVEVICDQGHDLIIYPSQIRKGPTCKKCLGKCAVQAKNDFYQKAKERGYQVVSQYLGTSEPVTVICEKGHKAMVTPYLFRLGLHVNTAGER